MRDVKAKRVQVIKPAFFQGRRVHPGDEIVVHEDFKASWIAEPVAYRTQVAPAKPAKPAPVKVAGDELA